MDRETDKYVKHYILVTRYEQVKYKAENIMRLLLVT